MENGFRFIKVFGVKDNTIDMGDSIIAIEYLAKMEWIIQYLRP